MIYEYALEPELVATWGDRKEARYWISQFGLGEPRIVSRYPKRWKRRVWEASAGVGEMERKRLEELIQRLSEVMVKRGNGPWDSTEDWLAKAQAEHARVPFHAILARTNSARHPQTLIADEVDDTTLLWALPRDCPPARNPSELANAVAGMLKIANVIVFVDPYFGPQNSRHRQPLVAFLRAVVRGRPCELPSRVEVHCSADGGGVEEGYFRDECNRRLPHCVPDCLCLKVVRLRERDGGELLHNRYILTDLGGVMLGAGLDEGPEGQTDDIILLGRELYEHRWRQYAGEDPSFDHPESSIIINGRMR